MASVDGGTAGLATGVVNWRDLDLELHQWYG